MRGRLVSLCGEWKQGQEKREFEGGKREEKGRMSTLIDSLQSADYHLVMESIQGEGGGKGVKTFI